MYPSTDRNIQLIWVVKYRRQMFKAAVRVSDKIVFVQDRR